MAIWYVSNEAINGYTVGNDTTGNGSAALPYLTIAKAITVAANTGDTIYVNGTTYTVNSVTLSKAVNMQPTVAYGTTIKTTNATRNLNISHALGGTNTIGAFILDQYYPITPSSAALAVQLNTSAVKYTVVFQGTQMINCYQYGVGCTSGAILADVSFSGGCVISNNASVAAYNTGFINAILLNTISSGSLTVTGSVASPGLTITVTPGSSQTAATQTMIALTSTGAAGAVTCSLSGVVINASTTSGAGVKAFFGAVINNVSGFYLGNSSISVTSTNASHTIDGINVTTSGAVGGRGAQNAIVEYNTFTLNTAGGGHVCLLGDEVPDGVKDNLTDGAIIRYNTVVGSDAAATAMLHGLMLGNNRNGQVYNNTISKVYIGVITKEGTGHVVHHNATSQIPVGGQHLRSKAATTNFYLNTCTAATSYTGTFISNTENDGATRYSASTFRRNKLLNPSNVALQALNCPTGNTAYLYNNIYQGTGVLSFIYGSSYASWALFKAARKEALDNGFGKVRGFRTRASRVFASYA
jgi:hypothetical protein